MGFYKTIKYNPTMEGMAEVIPDIVFSYADGEELKMQLILPWWDREGDSVPSYPLVIFTQGSSWTFPNVWYEVPQLSELAKRGFAVATITHRNALEGKVFPACLQDIKTAIRYLRANAETYGIDAERVGLWGTSSGANLSLLAAMTEGDGRYTTVEHTGYPDKVDYVVACFPTTDFVEYYCDENSDNEIKNIFDELSGGKVDEDMTVLKKMSPYYLVKDAADNNEKVFNNPVFLAHGDADELIPHRQTMKLYEIMKETGYDVSMVTVEGGPHEQTFWSREMLAMIFEFIEANC